ncbi:hypothetical protein [Wolbachia pipientis]|uniref:hypothetical protein n=1 Tax=Wolbachia pipientis TaxID=955 RepID=UPI0025A4BB5E|nr:hypothetical protein [Wolbachia pipientis]MDM8335459.1 hypothetical protein [Wolbachia pipientis]
MKSVKLKAKFFFLVLILLIASNVYSDTCQDIYFRTDAEAVGSSIGKGFWNFITGKWGDLRFDPHLLKEIKVTALKDQRADGFFNPRIKVCDYEGDNCYILTDGTSCRQIYGTQASGAGISAAVFIDWEGDTILDGGKIKEGIAKGLGWEWADNVTKEEQEKFAKSPKICACGQKAACMGDFFSYFARIGEGANIFRPGDMTNTCDTCYQKKVKCAPVPLAPGPPPFCEQLAMSPPQVRIVPITNKDNDYFNPKVKVIIGDLRGGDGKVGQKLDFPKKDGKDNSNDHHVQNYIKNNERYVPDQNSTIYYFKTYREKDKLCTEYHGTEREKSKRRLQFPARCFPAPPAPEPKVLEIVQSNMSGRQSNTLKIRMKMSRNVCDSLDDRAYSDGFCTFNVYSNRLTNIGPLSLKVVNPAIVAKTTDGNNSKSNIDNIIEGILKKNDSQFKVLKEYGYVPDIETECKEFQGNKCKLDSLGRPEVEIKYKENSKSKMLCLSGWKPRPKEFVIKRENEIIPLKSMGTKYIKYDAVYSKESNQFYYLPSKDNKEDDLLQRPQEKLDEIIFNRQGYVFFPEKNMQEKGKCSYCVNKNDEIDAAFQSGTGLKVVYKLMDAKHGERCDQGQDGCICFNGKCSRSTQYLNKKDDKPFYLRYEEVICKNEKGEELKNKKGEAQNCIQLKDQSIKANRTEVFYADKLCMFNLKNIKKRVLDIIREQLKNKSLSKPYKFSGGNNYTGNLSKYGYIEIEAWGGGEAGHIKGKAHSTKSRPGMPGDYIKAQLKIDPDYPIIKAQATEGGGRQTHSISNKDGGPTWIAMCDSHRQNCRPLITVAGGGVYKKYGNREYRKTKIHVNNLRLEEPTIVTGKASIQNNQIAYIENGKIKYEAVQCSSASSSNKHGAGGCINRSSKTYGRGSPGYVIIRSVQIDDEEVKKIIDALVENPGSTPSVSDLIEKLHPGITQKIKDEITRELLGL